MLGKYIKNPKSPQKVWCLVALYTKDKNCVTCLLLFSCEESKVKINMDVTKKEMDLLSNSIAAYAHIKGK